MPHAIHISTKEPTDPFAELAINFYLWVLSDLLPVATGDLSHLYT